MEYVDHKFQFSLQDVLEKLPDEAKVAFIEALSCEDAIVKHVMDQVLNTCTENGWHGGKSGDGAHTPYSPIDVARREIAERSSEVAAKTIEALKRQIEIEKESASKAWELYHAESEMRRRHA